MKQKRELERVFQRKLDDPWIIGRGGNETEGRTGDPVADWTTEIWGIGEVEEFGAETEVIQTPLVGMRVRVPGRYCAVWEARRMPTPQLPKSVPSPMAGASVNASGLRQRLGLTRENMFPEVAGFRPVHCAREKAERLPYTMLALLSVTVTGVPDSATATVEMSQFERAA